MSEALTAAIGALTLATMELTAELRAHKASLPSQGVAMAALGAVARSKPESPTPAAADHQTMMVQPPTAAGIPRRGRIGYGWATEARQKVLREMYPVDATRDMIMRALADLPGDPLPGWQNIQIFAIQKLKLRRVRKGRQKAVWTRVPEPSTAAIMLADDLLRASDSPIDLESAREWGRRREVELTGDPVIDMRRINNRRRALGLPAWRVTISHRHYEPLPRESVGGRE